ncbi:MAG: adenylyltransferase/cytidyltransferase family protein [bacterium]|nr:adenylyltransferase/cytidyltransferase family protein [bacterium]
MTTVFTKGTFDLIHAGHMRYLTKAKSLGDKLIVGVVSDLSRQKIKGKKPLLPENLRREVVEGFKQVDEAIIIEEDNLLKTLKNIKPDILFTIETNIESGVVDKKIEKFVESYGGKVIVEPQIKPYFTVKKMIDRMAKLKVKQYIERSLGTLNLRIKEEDRHLLTNKPGFEFVISFSDADRQGGDKHIGVGKTEPISCLVALREKADKEKKKIVFTGGSWDILHIGHIRYLQDACKKGDILVVGVASNNNIRKFKGDGRPVIDEDSRAGLINFIKGVNNTVIYNDVMVILQLLKPDVLWTPEESWNDPKTSAEGKLVLGYGGEVIKAKKGSDEVSASKIIYNLAGRKVKEIFKKLLE